MKIYEIYVTKQFHDDFDSLDKSVRDKLSKSIEHLRVSPYSGKPLGYRYFREKKAGKFRIYYLIYEEYVVVFVVAISSKTNQRQTIDTIIKKIEDYKAELKNIKSFFSKF